MSRELELARWLAAAPPFVYWVAYHTNPRKVGSNSPTTAKHLVKLLEAKAKGKTLQVRKRKTKVWVDTDQTPWLTADVETYRIKP